MESGFSSPQVLLNHTVQVYCNGKRFQKGRIKAGRQNFRKIGSGNRRSLGKYTLILLISNKKNITSHVLFRMSFIFLLHTQASDYYLTGKSFKLGWFIQY